MDSRKTILMVANIDWIFIYHRLEIAIAARAEGYKVVVLAKNSGMAYKIINAGLEFIDFPISRSGTHVLQEFKVIRFVWNCYKKVRPDLVYQVTMKPVIYGTLICKILNIKSVNGISGLGYNFTANRRSLVQRVMIQLMKFGFNKKNNHLIFENKDDFNELRFLDIINKKNKVHITNGVGVNLKHYFPQKNNNSKVTVILVARMLWDKGVKEFVEAAKKIKDEYKGIAVFKLYGMVDDGNIQAVPKEYLEEIQEKAYLTWEGHKEDMFEVYKNADIVVLPSYREGMPTVLLEASAMGLPLITTDAIGCKECVIEGENGYKVAVGTVDELAIKIKLLIDSPQKRLIMGENSRSIAVVKYNRDDVVRNHLKIFKN